MDDKPTLNELPALLAAELNSIGLALNGVSRAIISSILDDAVARAEAAEARVAELINANNELARLNVDMQVQVTDLQAALTAAEHERNDANIEAALNESNRADAWQRVAELEAALDAERAAHRWRPPAEEPSEPGYYLVILRDWLWPCEIQRWEGPGPFGPNGWTIEIRDRVVAWQPLPDAPQEPPQ